MFFSFISVKDIAFVPPMQDINLLVGFPPALLCADSHVTSLHRLPVGIPAAPYLAVLAAHLSLDGSAQ